MKVLKRTVTLLLAALLLFFACTGLCSCKSGNKERKNDTSNTLYVGHVGTSFPSSYMPWQSRDGIAPTVSSMIYSTLFTYDDLTGEFLPNLAKSWCYIDKDGNPLVTADGKVDYDRLEEVYGSSGSYIPVKVTLYDNATWSDGKKVTADDLFFSYDLCANNKLSNHAGALAWVSDLNHSYTNGVNTNYGIYTANHNPGGVYTFSDEEKDTVCYLHVKKVLGAITTLFTTVLILPEHIWSPIISADNPINSTEPNDALRYQYEHPVGCGPFTLDVDSTNAQVIVLNRREDYHLTDEEDPTKPLYKVDTIKFILYQEENVAIFSLLKGYIDVLDSSINPNYKVLFENEDDIQVLTASNPFVLTLVLNMNPTTATQTQMRKFLMNTDFRRALALAIDQEDLIKNVQNGAASTYSLGLVSETVSAIYNDKIYEDEELSSFTKTWDERVQEANEILDAVCPEKDSDGYRVSDGKRLSFEILGVPTYQDLVSYLQIQFQKIGVEVKYAAAGSSPEKTYLYTGKFDMTLQGVTFTSSTVDIMMESHFVNTGTSSNYGRLLDSDLKAEIAAMKSTLNLNAKNEALKELQVSIAKEYYKIPLYSSKIISVARTDRYEGWVASDGNTAFSTDSLKVLKEVG